VEGIAQLLHALQRDVFAHAGGAGDDDQKGIGDWVIRVYASAHGVTRHCLKSYR
jgi:hypothetical protein